MTRNADDSVVEGFGEEWSKLDQTKLTGVEFERTFNSYFDIFPWHSLPAEAVGFDVGCGSGRWASGVAPRVGLLHCIDASPKALDVARRNLAHEPKVQFHLAAVDAIPLLDASMDFGYCLGVLHHVPDTREGLRAVTAKLKPGAPFLLYLYYDFDNRPLWFRWLHRGSESLRWLLSRCPFWLRYGATQAIAAAVYWPLARTARVLERAGFGVRSFPLSFYRDRSFYTMRTDALDRFGTRLEQRFSRREIQNIMEQSGLRDILFSEQPPFWCALGYKR